MKNPADLGKEELACLIIEIQSILWPGDNPDSEWDADTIDAVASVIVEAGLGPEESDRKGGL